MLILTSPAKTLIEQGEFSLSFPATKPRFSKEAARLVEVCRQQNPQEIQKLMSISEKLAQLNYDRFQNWQTNHTSQNSRPALYMYNGDIYRELKPHEYTISQQNYAQNSLRIITGLYGILRAYDLLQPYRLEMKLDLSSWGGPRLTEYWQKSVTDFLNQDLADQDSFVLNLASKEYADAVNFAALKRPTISVDFLQKYPDGQIKNVGILAKKGRGMLIDYCIKQEVRDRDTLKAFTADGYKITNETEDKLTFTRKHTPIK